MNLRHPEYSAALIQKINAVVPALDEIIKEMRKDLNLRLSDELVEVWEGFLSLKRVVKDLEAETNNEKR